MKPAKSLKARILRGAAVVVVLQVCTQLTGLLSQTMIAAWFGTSAVTDAWVVAISVVSLVTLWITLPIRQVLIPMFRHDLTKLGEDAAWRNATVLMNNLVPLFAAITVVAWIAAPWLVALVGAGFTEENAALATSLTRILLLSVVTIGLANFLAQLYYSYHRFFLPELCGSISNLATAAGLLILGTTWGIHGVAVGVVGGGIIIAALQMSIVREHRRSVSWRIDFRHPGMTEMRRLSLPVFVGAGSIETERIVDRVFASFLSVGSLSALAFARLLSRFPETLLLEPFQKTTHPHFTTLIAEENYRTLSQQLFQYVRFLLFLTVPAATGMFLLGDGIVRVVFLRGAFDETATTLTSQALAFYALGLPAVFAGRVFHQTFIALKDTRTPMRLGLLRIGTKIVLTFALLPFFAHAAIALAESVSHYVRLVWLVALLPAQVKEGQIGQTLRSLGGTVAISAVMAVAVIAAKEASDGALPLMWQLGALVVVGAVTYFAAGWLSRQSEIAWIGRSLRTLAERHPAAAL
ncbi:MAG: murein biosynthesis integral membrane protein MurJ [Candidatus Binatia bacterium]